MRWPGHKAVPGVAPERDQRPEDASTHLGHATPRRRTLLNSEPTGDTSPNPADRSRRGDYQPSRVAGSPDSVCSPASAGWRMPARGGRPLAGMPAELGKDVAPHREHAGLIKRPCRGPRGPAQLDDVPEPALCEAGVRVSAATGCGASARPARRSPGSNVLAPRPPRVSRVAAPAAVTALR